MYSNWRICRARATWFRCSTPKRTTFSPPYWRSRILMRHRMMSLISVSDLNVFKLANLSGTRNVVQVFNAEEDHLFATILAIPHTHATPHDEPYIGFEERPR